MQPPRFDRANVLVTGDLILDRYCEGAAARLSPEAPVPVVQVERMTDRPGGAGNVAMNLAAVGARATLVAACGDDPGADALADLLGAAGVDCDLARVDGCATTTKLRVLARHQQLLRLDFDQPLAAPAAVTVSLGRRMDTADLLVLSDYGKGALGDAAVIVALARERGLPVFADPRGPDFSAYRGVDLLTPNRAEFEACVGACADDEALLARGRELTAALDLGALLITRGEQGMTLFLGERHGAARGERHFPARAREVFDVTGAGDTVVAVAAAAAAAGVDLVDAVALANIAAGLVVGRLGAATVSEPELRAALAGQPAPGRGVLEVSSLAAELERCRSAGKRVVFTNGCFDILHAGHVACLEEAAAMGDCLVVAVNSDASVRRLKGDGRPVNPLERRMAVLAALSSVDFVVPFDADTPEDLLAQLRPDVLVKGGDYSSKAEVVGREVVESYGGEVRLTGHVEQASTTAILRDAAEMSKG